MSRHRSLIWSAISPLIFVIALTLLLSYTHIMLNMLTISKLRITKSQLHQGDCCDVVKTLPDSSIDCLLTDPPYGVFYKSASRRLALKSIANDDHGAYDLIDRAFINVYPKLKDQACILIACNWQSYASIAAVVGRHFRIKNVLIWEKNGGSKGDLKGNWSYDYEMFIFAFKGKRRRELNGKRDRNILKFNRLPANYMKHPTEKPVPLLKYLIEKTTAPGDIVLDMFMGSGSTCVAAQESDRLYIGIDTEPVWVQVAEERLQAQSPCNPCAS